MLADLEAQQANLRNTLFRISGAIQVLEELLATSEVESQDNSHSSKLHQLSSRPF